MLRVALIILCLQSWAAAGDWVIVSDGVVVDTFSRVESQLVSDAGLVVGAVDDVGWSIAGDVTASGFGTLSGAREPATVAGLPGDVMQWAEFERSREAAALAFYAGLVVGGGAWIFLVGVMTRKGGIA